MNAGRTRKPLRRGKGKKPQAKRYPVLSRQAKRDAFIVATTRILSNLATATALLLVAALLVRAHEGDLTLNPMRDLLPPILAATLAALAYVAEFIYGGISARAEERRIRHAILQGMFQAVNLPSSPHEAQGGAIISYLSDNAERMSEYRQIYFGATLAAMSIPFLTLLGVSIVIDPFIGLSLVLACILIPVLINFFMRFFRKTSANSRRQRAQLSGKYLDAIRNLVTIRLLGAGQRIEDELRSEGEKNRGAIMKLLAANQIVIIILDGLFSLLLIVAATLLAVTRLHTGAINEMEALAVVALIVLLLEPLTQVAGFFYIGMGGMASERAISAYLKNANRTPKSAGEDVHVESDIAIAVRNLGFNYGRGKVFSGVNFDIPRGRKVAILGPSGAGKTTLLSLLRGALPLQEGGVNLDGHSLNQYRHGEGRMLSATLAQRTWLFTGTIADNLRLAAPEASEEEMWDALERAQVADDIRRMPDGLETDCGERAALISGGQAQRLSLARAFLSGRKILLLDEPTSQVDVESEARILESLRSLDKDWTLVMVTHRLALLELADMAIHIEAGEGRLIEGEELDELRRQTNEFGLYEEVAQ